jgi:hypothetical protein
MRSLSNKFKAMKVILKKIFKKGSEGGLKRMRMLILGLLLSVFVNTVSIAGDDDRRAKAIDKQKKKADKRQKELISRTVKSHEIKIYRREKLRVPKKVQDHVMEYKRKSKTEDKKTVRKTRRTYKKLDRENDQIVNANKRNYSTKYSKDEFETVNSPDDSSEGTVKMTKKHIKKKDRGKTTFNDPETVVRQIR